MNKIILAAALAFGPATAAPLLAQDSSTPAWIQRGAKGERTVYDTRRLGHSNAGHDFGTDLSSGEKAPLIEYLKTL